MEVAEQSAVPSVRSKVKEICHNAEHSKDISHLLDCATQLSEYLFYIQEQESGLNALTTDARLLINAAKESIKTSEYASAIFLNSAQGGGLAMNKAEKILKKLIAEVVSEILDTPKKSQLNEVIRKKGKKWHLYSKKKTNSVFKASKTK